LLQALKEVFPGMMVPGRKSQQLVVGLITGHLRIMALGIKEVESNESLLSPQCVGDFAAQISQVILAGPTETVGMYRTVIAQNWVSSVCPF
jgi:hypothetical protein